MIIRILLNLKQSLFRWGCFFYLSNGGVKALIKRYLALVMIFIFNCFPIKKNKIFFFSYYGSQYGDSPKYITEHILKNYQKDRFDVVWAFNDLKKKEHLSGFRKVKTMSLKYFYDLCTSK